MLTTQGRSAAVSNADRGIREGTAELQGDTAAAGVRPRLHTWQDHVKGEDGHSETFRQKE